MLRRLALRNLAAHKGRLIMTTIAVVLGVAFVSGSLIMRDSTARSFDKLFEQSQEQAVVVQATQPDAAPPGTPPRLVPDSLLPTLREKVPTGAEFRRSYQGYAAVLGQDDEVVGSAEVQHIGRDFADTSGDSIKIVSGHEPTAATEVIIDSRTASVGGFAVGDQVRVVTMQPLRTMKVSGVFELTDDTVGDLVTYVGFTPEVAADLLVDRGYSSAIWVQPPAGTTEAELADRLGDALPSGYEAVTATEQGDRAKSSITTLLNLLSGFMLAFALISVCVGSFIIFNTFTMLVAQRTRELALLRAVGASRGQIRRIILSEALGIGMLGSLVGLGAGFGVAIALRALLGMFGADLPSGAPVLAPLTVGVGFAVGILITLLAAYLPARRAAKVPPVAALRDDPAAHAGTSKLRVGLGVLVLLLAALAMAGGMSEGGQDGAFLVGLGAVVGFIALTVLAPSLTGIATTVLGAAFARWGGNTGRLARENARREPRRTASTASALMVGLALVSMAAVLAASMNASVDKDYDRQFGADYALESSGFQGFSPAAAREIAQLPQVDSVATLQTGSLKVAGSETAVVVADPEELKQPVDLTVLEGDLATSRGEVLVDQDVARADKLAVGDALAVTFPDKTKSKLRVSAIYASNSVVGAPYIVSSETYRPHSSSVAIARAYVTLADGASVSRSEVEQALSAYPAVKVIDREAAKADARKDTDQLVSVILGLLVLSIVIAGVGIANTLALSVIERTREIGILRAIGMSRRQLRAMVRIESVIISLFGAVVGIAAGVASGWAIQRTLVDDGIAVLDIPVGQLGMYLGGSVVLGIVASLWPAWRSSRMPVLEAITAT